MVFRFTGWGWVTPIMTALFLIAGLLGGIQATDVTWGLLIAAAVMVVAAGVNYLVSMAVNSTRTPTGRVWHDRNTVSGVPMQTLGTAVDLAWALILVAVEVGHLTTALVGWLLALALLVGGIAWRVRAGRRVLRRERSQP